MNELSWILYWADVLPSLARAVGFCFGVLTVAALVLFTVWVIFSFCPEDDPHAQAYRAKCGFARWLWAVTLGVALSSNFVPSRETFYAIAVSEAGEEVLKSPEAGKARQALNAWLDNQINELSEDGEPVEAQ